MMKQLTDKDLNTEAKQVNAIKTLYRDFAKKHVTDYQVIANNLFVIASASHETNVSNNVITSLRDNYINNVAYWYEQDWNHLHYNDYNETDQNVFPSLKAMMNKCEHQHIDPNDYWVTTDIHDSVVPITSADLALVFNELLYTTSKNGKTQLKVVTD